MTDSRRAAILEDESIIEDRFGGEYIILSVDDYNKIVRQLNILTNIVQDQYTALDGRIRALLENSLEVVE